MNVAGQGRLKMTTTINIHVGDRAAEAKVEHRNGSQSLLSSSAKSKIGLVSSISITQELYNAFENGVNDRNILITPRKGNVGYKKGDRSALITTIRNNLTNTDLLVTLGGSVAYEAAKEANVTEFISLIGNVPRPPAPLFWGGVSLECIVSNKDRLQYLTEQKHIDITNIFLFYNRNSEMNAAELSNWSDLTNPNTQIFAGGTNADGVNDPTVYGANFTEIGANSNIRALIVSSDPFFQDSKQNLIAAANTWLQGATNRYICYPSRSYINNGRPGQSTVFGPSMVDAYNLMGQIAANALIQPGPQPLLRLSNYPQDL